MFLKNYLGMWCFLIMSVLLAMIVFILPYIFSPKVDDSEKLSSYECGFNPFEDSRGEFDVKFYLVAMLFIVFDLEISFLFPFVLCLDQIGSVGMYAMYVFLIVLTVGFFYEWKKGALDWD